MRNKILSSLLFFLIISTGVYGEEGSILSLIFSGGANWGNIAYHGSIENRIDSVTGASRIRAHGGVTADLEILDHHFETGLMYVYSNQDLTYNDPSASLDGTREFRIHNLVMPLYYNFYFFKRADGNPRLIFGAGLFGSYSPHQVVNDTGALGDYDLRRFAGGISWRLTYYPFVLRDDFLLGIYLGIYRSYTHFYLDDYYKDQEAGEVGNAIAGISLKIN